MASFLPPTPRGPTSPAAAVDSGQSSPATRASVLRPVLLRSMTANDVNRGTGTRSPVPRCWNLRRFRKTLGQAVAFHVPKLDLVMSDSIDEECLKFLRGSLQAMPVVIRCSLLKPKASASDRLKWTGLAFRLVHGPLGRTVTDLDRTNALEAADILREVVPQLEKIRNGHSSARLRHKADHYLRRIATETGRTSPYLYGPNPPSKRFD
jgi:hypothetical protein